MPRELKPQRFWPILLYLIGLGLLGLLIWHYDPAAISYELTHLSLPWVLLSGVAIVIAGVLGAVNVFLFISRDHRISLRAFFPLHWCSWAIGLLVPGQVGDLASIGFLLRRHAMPLSKVWGRAGVDKVISLLVMLGFSIVGSCVLVRDLPGVFVWLSAIAVLMVTALVTFYLTRHMWQRVFAKDSPGLAGAVTRMFAEFIETVQRTPGRVLLNAGLTILKITITGFAYWAAFRALGIVELPMWQVVICATMAGLIAYLPLSVNGLGTVEAAGVFLFGQLSVPAAAVISAYIVLRVLVIVIAWVPTIVWWALAARRPSLLS